MGAPAFDLRDRFETLDGARPDPTALDDVVARELPLVAFRFLEGGDAFDGGVAPADAAARARAWADARLELTGRPSRDEKERTRAEAARLLAGNPTLVARMMRAKPIAVDIVPAGASLASYGYLASVNERAAGLYWDHPTWPKARIALRAEHLFTDEVLVVHEVAHAVHGLAFTKKERALIDAALRPTFVDRASMDEAFAIYAEREMCKDFSALEKKAPGIYGFVRRQWHEDQRFVRFVRKLWWPFRPLAGPKLATATSWRRFSGS